MSGTRSAAGPLRHLAVITGNYPSPAHPNRGTFVRQFVEAIAAQGVRTTVIHPWSLHTWLRHRRRGEGANGWRESDLQVLRPLTLSFSNRRIGPVSTFTVTESAFRRSVWCALRGLSPPPDALYGHFLYPAGRAAVWAAFRLGRPGFLSVGEGNFWTLRPVGLERARRELAGMAGAIAVSTVLRQRLIEQLRFPPDRVVALPNGVNPRLFLPLDRAAMRRKHSLPGDRFLAIYVGNFIEPKGVTRVSQAIDCLPGVAGVFVGSGPCLPRAGNVVFCGRVGHELVPELLSAADCFVLPSDVEGCSNATLEALSCGLPVIVADGAYNDDIVTDEVALRVPYADVEAIRAAVVRLRDDPALRRQMAERAVEHARQFDVRVRARRVLDWMGCRMEPKFVEAPSTADTKA